MDGDHRRSQAHAPSTGLHDRGEHSPATRPRAPGRQTRTEQLAPPSRAVQHKPASSPSPSASAGPTAEDWTAVAFRPDVHQQPASPGPAHGVPSAHPGGPTVQLAKNKNKDTGPANRGRLQIQGGGLERSWPWAQAEAPTAAEAAGGLDGLWNALSSRQQSTRDEAYAKARAYILDAAPDGVGAPVSKTFQNKNLGNNGDHRVDIEVHKGTAFVG